MIRQKLMQKGIPKPLIDKRLAEEDFSELAGKIGEKLVGRYQRKLPLRALQDKVVQGLMGKGFLMSQPNKAWVSWNLWLMRKMKMI